MKASALVMPASLSLTAIFLASALIIESNSEKHEAEMLNQLTEINGDTVSYPEGLIFTYKSNATLKKNNPTPTLP